MLDQIQLVASSLFLAIALAGLFGTRYGSESSRSAWLLGTQLAALVCALLTLEVLLELLLGLVDVGDLRAVAISAVAFHLPYYTRRNCD